MKLCVVPHRDFKRAWRAVRQMYEVFVVGILLFAFFAIEIWERFIRDKSNDIPKDDEDNTAWF